jgi:DNA mismatch repair ATPase MutS
MLSDAVRVHNDVSIGPAGTLLLVTGSNMSGKSTLLRAVGVNTVLAQAGAPVCASAYRAPILQLHTSINIRDSLTAGVSLYMAQLNRLKEVLDAARSATPTQPCCYLLDEILSGTNSADRTVAVRAVLHQLLQSNAIGVVTTHDLAVAADERLQKAAVNIHFAETIDPAPGTMTFDYRVRPGPVQRSNALELMRLMGIHVD